MSCFCCASTDKSEITLTKKNKKITLRAKPSIPKSSSTVVSPNTLVEIEPERVMRKRITFTPKADIVFDPNHEEVVLVMEIPGFKTEDIDVEIGSGLLTVSGPKSSSELFDKYGDNLVLHAKERDTGYFRRVFKLPNNVLDDTAAAMYKCGMLEIKLKCVQFCKNRKLEIKG